MSVESHLDRMVEIDAYLKTPVEHPSYVDLSDLSVKTDWDAVDREVAYRESLKAEYQMHRAALAAATGIWL